MPLGTQRLVVALSLRSIPLKKVRSSTKGRVGHIFDTFSPWTVLLIELCPTLDCLAKSKFANENYLNGPEAFLKTIQVVLEKARESSKRVSHEIYRTVDFPVSSIFPLSLRTYLIHELPTCICYHQPLKSSWLNIFNRSLQYSTRQAWINIYSRTSYLHNRNSISALMKVWVWPTKAFGILSRSTTALLMKGFGRVCTRLSGRHQQLHRLDTVLRGNPSYSIGKT